MKVEQARGRERSLKKHGARGKEGGEGDLPTTSNSVTRGRRGGFFAL